MGRKKETRHRSRQRGSQDTGILGHLVDSWLERRACSHRSLCTSEKNTILQVRGQLPCTHACMRARSLSLPPSPGRLQGIRLEPILLGNKSEAQMASQHPGITTNNGLCESTLHPNLNTEGEDTHHRGRLQQVTHTHPTIPDSAWEIRAVEVEGRDGRSQGHGRKLQPIMSLPSSKRAALPQ